jgi:hypothetical protein
VLVAGGVSASAYLSSVELYNPSTGIWSSTGSLANAHCDFAAMLLSNGQVLAAGGLGGSGLPIGGVELYTPAAAPSAPLAAATLAKALSFIVDHRS